MRIGSIYQQRALRLVSLIVLVCALRSGGNGIDIDTLNAGGPHRLGSGFVSTIAFSPDGKTIAAAHQTNPATEPPYTDTVLLWDAQTQEQIGEFPVGPVRAIAFNPDGTLLALGEESNHVGSHTVWLWDVGGHTQVGAIQSPGPYGLESLAFSPDGTLLASTASGGSATYLWDVQSLESLGTVSAECRSVAFSPDGTLLVTGGNRQDTTIRLWDPETQTQVGQLIGHLIDTLDLAFSPDGAVLASAGGWEDSAVYLWNIETQQQIGLLGGHPAHVGSVAFSPRSQFLASVSYWNGIVFLWGAQTQTQIGQLADHDVSSGFGWGHEVAFSSDGKWLACSSDDGVELWAVALVGPVATAPEPSDKAVNVFRRPILHWTPGPYAQEHDVYLGTSFDDVNGANTTDAVGGVYRGRQGADIYPVPEPLAFDQTYYWRVDEVNGPPDHTIFKGDVWNFTAESLAYPIEHVMATSNADSEAVAGPENTVNGSGLNANDEHSIDSADMWLGAPRGADPVYLQYEFDSVYKLQEMWVWNYNVQFEPSLGFGLKDVTIEYSLDGLQWTLLSSVEFAQATTKPDYMANTVVDLQGIAARYIRLTIDSGWGTLGQFGLSEVRFFYIPVQPSDPQPADGATTEDLDVTLRWRPGRGAVSHLISVRTDLEDMVDMEATEAPVYSLAEWDLGYGTTYYWSVTEVNEAESTSTYAGDLWHFNTPEFRLLDDFERYRDHESFEIWATWADGFEDPANGSVAGNENDAETKVVYDGRKSLPIHYDNSQAATSEVTRTFDPPEDFTGGGADTLSMYYRGHAPAFEEEPTGAIRVRGAGVDIWNTADDFRFIWKCLQGDGTIVARVDSLVATDAWAKAGVMVRASLTPGSSFAGVYFTGENGVHFQARLLADLLVIGDTETTVPGQTAVDQPVWLKLQRTGNKFIASYATDEAGADWTAIPWSPRAISMPQEVYIGLAVTSHVVGQPTTAVFSGVVTTGSVTGMWTAEAIGGDHPGNEPEPFYVVLEDGLGETRSVYHPDPEAVLNPDWWQWRIPLSMFGSLDLSQIMKMTIGLGDSGHLPGGGRGTLYIDNIGVGRPRTAP